LVRDANGNLTPAYTPGTKPLQQIVTDPVTGQTRLVSVPGTPGQTVGGQTASAPASGGQDRAGRNNNPGNLRWDGQSKWQGMTGVDKDGFVMFDSPANGQRALGINIANQQKLHGINTVTDLITKYAPPKDHNDTAAYISTVSRALGVGPNDQINLSDPNVQRVLSATISGVESSGTPTANRTAQAQAPAPNGPTVTDLGGGGGPVWKDDNRNGMAGQTNTRTGEFKPFTGQKTNSLSPKQAQDAKSKLAIVDQLEGVLNKLEQHGNSSWFTGSVLGQVPSNLVGGDADRFESDIASARQSIQALTRIPGVGASSDYESRLTAALSPSRTQSGAGRKETIENARSIVAGLKGALTDSIGDGQAAPTRQNTPPPQGKPTRTATNPQTGQKLGLINGKWVAM
jgi:hypothetical protein